MAVTLVPLDVTMQHRWSEADAARLAAGLHPLHRTLAAMLPVYFDSYEPRLGERVIPLHDPLAAAIAVGLLRPDKVSGVHPGGQSIVRSVDQPAGPVILNEILSL